MYQPTSTTAERPMTAVTLHRERPMSLLPLVVPVMDNERIMEAWRNFQDLKLRLLEPSDFVMVKGQPLAKKSAFRKLALAFGISTELVKEELTETKEGTAHLMTIKAIAPSGRFMTAVASCCSNERAFTKTSDVRAIAETRATNRAIGNLIGWSTPSAEEITDEHEESPGELESQHPRQPEGLITEKQKTYIAQLLSQRFPDPEEREQELARIEGLSKQDASDLISSLLRS